MKTLWIIDHYSSEPKYGGYTRQYNFARGLADLGYNVLVIASSFSHFKHEYISDQDLFFSEISPHVHYVYIRTTSYQENGSMKRFLGMLSFLHEVRRNRKKLEKKFGKPSWVLGSSPHPFSWVAAHLCAKKNKAKFYIEVRDFWPLELRGENDGLAHRLLFFLLDKLEDWAFNKAERIVCTMPFGYEYISEVKGFPREKCLTIGQPLDCSSFDNLAEKSISLLPNDLLEFIKDSFFCVFAGYYKRYEGIFEMLEAAKNAKEKQLNIKFVFVGSGDEKDNMLSYVSDNDLDNTYIGGRVDKNAIPALIKQSGICLAYLNDSSNPEMFRYGLSKNKLNEYLYSGAVTILGFPYSRNEVNESGAGFTFDPCENRFPELIEKIYKMDGSERKQLGHFGRTYVHSTHDINVLSRKYANELLDLEKEEEKTAE